MARQRKQSNKLEPVGEVVKRGRGRPKGRKVFQALEAASSAAVAIEKLDDTISKMVGDQKLMFESVLAGDDSLITALKSHNERWFVGITKLLTNSDGSRIMSNKLTLENVNLLEDRDYCRLVRLCDSMVRHNMGGVDYSQYIEPIKKYAERYAPMAFGNIMNIANNSTKDDVRLKANNKILELGGVRAPEVEKGDTIIPVQLNIMLTSNDGTTTQYNPNAIIVENGNPNS